MKNIKNNLFWFIIGLITATTIGVGASVLYNSSEIGFTPSNADWEVNNLEDAINDLYNNRYNFNGISKTFNISHGTNTKRTTTVEVDKGKYLVLGIIDQSGSAASSGSSTSNDYQIALNTNGTCNDISGKFIHSSATSQFISQYLWNNFWYTIYICDFDSAETISISNFQTGNYNETISAVSLDAIRIQ